MRRSRAPRRLPAPSAAAGDVRSPAPGADNGTAERGLPAYAAAKRTELFVWFEDNRQRPQGGWRGAAGFPECLLPYDKGIRVLERRYVEGHCHLLAAARIRCNERLGECVATIYTSALALGTIAWIGTGEPYRRAWVQMYPNGAASALAARRSPTA